MFLYFFCLIYLISIYIPDGCLFIFSADSCIKNYKEGENFDPSEKIYKKKRR